MKDRYFPADFMGSLAEKIGIKASLAGSDTMAQSFASAW